jgi:hypothetical protein
MPYWGIHCIFCGGYIVDAMLECLPPASRLKPAYKLLFHAQPGAALACPYCNELFGFDDDGRPCVPIPGWPVFRYGRVELEMKKVADGEPTATSLSQWALKHRFIQPGVCQPLSGYIYAEQAPPNETAP